MSLKFTVEEDVSEGLTKLQERVSEKMKFILREITYEFTGKEGESAHSGVISQRMSTRYNPYLYKSARPASAKTYEISDDEATVIINYSGKAEREGRPEEDDFKVWWEFSEEYEDGEDFYTLAYKTDPMDRTLARDYAYYQETGIDPVASSKDAKYKWAITMGLLGNGYRVPREAARNLSVILNQL